MKKVMAKKYREVLEWDGIKVGPASDFHAKQKYEINCTVLKIFPDGNNITWADEPYYVQRDNGALDYYSRDSFANSNISPIPIPDPKKFNINRLKKIV